MDMNERDTEDTIQEETLRVDAEPSAEEDIVEERPTDEDPAEDAPADGKPVEENPADEPLSVAREYTDEETAPYIGAVEGILFAMGNSVEISRIAEALEIEEGMVVAICDRLAKDFEEHGRGIRILRLEDSYQMCSAPEIYEYLIKIAKQPRKYVLTDVLLESLSIVAYKQPITRAEVEKIRGVDCSHAMNKLVEYGLIEEIGRLDAPGRPILFGTTEEFLRTFGVTSLEELPSISTVQMEEFKAEAEQEISLQLDV